jgi:FAD-dependent fumarate reductase
MLLTQTVTLLEKQKSCGGNSAKASSGINGAFTTVQKTFNVEDSVDVFREDTTRAGEGLGGEKLVDKLVAESSDAISFLRHVVGLPLADLIQLGGHSAPRTHRLSTHAPIGFTLVKGLQQMLQSMRGIRIETNAVVVDIRYEDVDGQRITRGVTYINSAGERIELDADAVSVLMHLLYGDVA